MENTETNDEFVRLMAGLNSTKPGTEQYDTLLNQLSRLINIQKMINEDKSPSLVDKLLNNEALVGGIFTGGIAFMMLNFERIDIITSQVRNLVRTRI